MSDLKVIPMLRGKGFEYTVTDLLKSLLDSSKWDISNPNINAQSEVHDVDVYVTRKKDNKNVRIECKLSDKDSFRLYGDSPKFQVKCMRSRTVSDNEMATRMARRYGVSRETVLAHPDNYRDIDFDFVITSMGNAFWTTDDTGRYIFKASNEQIKTLVVLFPKIFNEKDSIDEFKKKTFNFMIFAKSKSITATRENNVVCRRKRCITQGTFNTCGFIPNYPAVNLKELSEGRSVWRQLADIERALNELLDGQR